ncbi:MAG: hypothetical protein AAGK37_16860 [Pseudomonadota bacterium]
MNVDERGWVRFPADARSRAWADATMAAACRALEDPALDRWWRHGRTWFAGVGALPNAPDGAVDNVPLAGPALDALGWRDSWDKGQISVTRPGYPAQDPEETDAAHRYRAVRDAAHVDGLLPVGPKRRRMAREYHGFILGIALSDASPDASPLVVWERSHHVIAEALRAALEPRPRAAWPDVDLTETYHAARRRSFETCRRVTVPLAPGEAVLVHRHALHGVAPWAAGATSAPEGRAIAYFRPAIAVEAWLRDG